VFLNIKNGTGKDYLSVSSSVLINNLIFSAIGGTLWYMQFFFMGMVRASCRQPWCLCLEHPHVDEHCFSNIWESYSGVERGRKEDDSNTVIG